jgi:hypothetical protein
MRRVARRLCESIRSFSAVHPVNLRTVDPLLEWFRVCCHRDDHHNIDAKRVEQPQLSNLLLDDSGIAEWLDGFQVDPHASGKLAQCKGSRKYIETDTPDDR